MKRCSFIVIALLALLAAPQSAFSDWGCKGKQCDHNYFWVEIAGEGNCYVKFREGREANFTGWYSSPLFAYIAIARNPACYRTTKWLMQYEYIRRAVN